MSCTIEIAKEESQVGRRNAVQMPVPRNGSNWQATTALLLVLHGSRAHSPGQGKATAVPKSVGPCDHLSDTDEA